MSAAKGRLIVDRIEYGGWKNNVRLANGEVELIATLDVGPRILVYRRQGRRNVLKEYAELLGKSGEADWQIRGGHRLWTSPEEPARTYCPDNGPVDCRELPGGGVRLATPGDRHGIRKEIDLHLAASGSRVTLVHRITNMAEEPAELAVWALTVMAPGGLEIIPLPVKRPHPGLPTPTTTADDFAPEQNMVLWPFFDFRDPRWTFGTRYITLRQDATRGPTKIGLAHREGWVAYLNGGELFVKRFSRERGKNYPDRGCSFETFTNEDMLEAESLGPLVRLGKGETAELSETWELHPLAAELRDETDIDRHVRPMVG